MTATLYTATGCGPCASAARALGMAGIDFEVRDVRVDAAAEEAVIAMYAQLRPGRAPSAPVAVIGGNVCFGVVEIHQHIRQLTRAAA